MGVTAGQEALAQLHNEVEARLQPLGYQPERRAYSAHLTLARVKDTVRGHHTAVRAAVNAARGVAGTFRAERVTLFRSRLSPKGASYEALLRAPLS